MTSPEPTPKLQLEKFKTKVREVFIENKSPDANYMIFSIKPKPLTLVGTDILMRYSVIVMMEGDQTEKKILLSNASSIHDFIDTIEVSIDDDVQELTDLTALQTTTNNKFVPNECEYIDDEDMTIFYFEAQNPLTLVHKVDDEFLMVDDVRITIKVNTDREVEFDSCIPVPYTVGLLFPTLRCSFCQLEAIKESPYKRDIIKSAVKDAKKKQKKDTRQTSSTNY